MILNGSDYIVNRIYSSSEHQRNTGHIYRQNALNHVTELWEMATAVNILTSEQVGGMSPAKEKSLVPYSNNCNLKIQKLYLHTDTVLTFAHLLFDLSIQ